MLQNILVFVSLFLIFLHFYMHNNKSGKLIKKIPGPDGYPLIGCLFYFLRDPIESFYAVRNLVSLYGGIVRVRNVHTTSVIISEPESLETILSSTKFISKGLVYEALRPWLREGLLLSTSKKWQQRRKLLTPAFHFGILKNAFKTFNEGGKYFVEDMEKLAGEQIDIQVHIAKFSLHSICHSAMGVNLHEETSVIKEYRQAIHDIVQCITYRTARLLFDHNLFKLTPMAKVQTRVLKVLHDFTNMVINQRRAIHNNNPLDYAQVEEVDDVYSKKKRLAMLDLLLTMEKEDKIDQEGIHEEVDTFTFEGHDTTTSGIKFLWLNLANNKDIQDRLVEELKSVITSPDKEVDLDMVNNLPYLDLCVKESLRIFPPVPLFTRYLHEDLQLKNYLIPKGSSVDLHIFDMHRNHKLYPDPFRFDPERFTPENCAARHPYAYVPFSAGPRNCIGQKYALYELKTITITLLRNFILLPVTKPDELIFTLDVVLNTTNPIKMIFQKREDKF